jgi:hypothetical protein
MDVHVRSAFGNSTFEQDNVTLAITGRIYHLYFKVLSTTTTGYHKFARSFNVTQQTKESSLTMTFICRNMDHLLSEVIKLSIIAFVVYL